MTIIKVGEVSGNGYQYSSIPNVVTESPMSRGIGKLRHFSSDNNDNQKSGPAHRRWPCEILDGMSYLKSGVTS